MFTARVWFYKVLIWFLEKFIALLPQPVPLMLTGKGSSLLLCDEIARFGATKVLVVTDTVLRELGVLDAMLARLESLGVAYAIYDGVKPDPTTVHVKEGIALAKAEACDAILAVGGGSSIDSAKVISVGLTHSKTIEQLMGLFKMKEPGVPLYVVPTTAGTGSEVTLAAVISDPDTHEKGKVVGWQVMPVAAALDSEIMRGMPKSITAATGMDALTHAVEAYISRMATPATDRYALAAIKLIFANLGRSYEQGDDLDARHGMALASTYAGLAFTRAFVGYVHAIAHNFGAKYGTPHGLANALALPHVLRFSQQAAQARFADMAIAAGLGQAGEGQAVLAQRFVDGVDALSRQINIPQYLPALQYQDIPALAKAACREAHYLYAVPAYMDERQCEQLIAKMLEPKANAAA